MRMGVSEQSIKMMAWGSVSTDMLKIYAHLTVGDVENEMNQVYGINLENKLSTVPDIAAPIQCKKCGFINPKLHEFCGGCTAPLSGDLSGESGDEQTTCRQGRQGQEYEELLKVLERNGMYEELKEFLRSKIEA